MNSAKQYLKRIWCLEGRVKRDKARLESLRMAADGVKGIVYDADKVQTSPADTMSERVGALVDLQRKLVSEIVELEETKSEVLSVIHTLDDEPMEQMLYLRYLKHMNFYDIAAEMEYSLSGLHKLHARALTLIEQKRGHTSTHSPMV